MLNVVPLGKSVCMMEHRAVSRNELAMVCQHLVYFNRSSFGKLLGCLGKDPSVRKPEGSERSEALGSTEKPTSRHVAPGAGFRNPAIPAWLKNRWVTESFAKQRMHRAGDEQ